MCQSCWDELDQPRIVNDLTESVATMISEVYDYHEVGGHAHIVLDDWNLEDEHIDYCLDVVNKGGHDDEEVTQDQLKVEKACLEALKQMTLEERASALAIYYGFIDD